MSSNVVDIKHSDILKKADPESRFYGALLNWKGDDGFWHYGIGLSDDYIFDTGRGLQPFAAKHVNAKFVEHVSAYAPEQTLQRLIYALECFNHWDYGLLGWNCEHLARLVATNEPISYEVKNQFWPIPELNHNGIHPTAKEEFEAYLENYSSDFLRRVNS